MKANKLSNRPLSLSIGEVRVRAASGIDARRIADALPAALVAALAESAERPICPTPVERVAWAVVDAVHAKLERPA